MLVQRVVTAGFLLGILLLLIVWGSPWAWQILVWLVGLALYVEFQRLKPCGFWGGLWVLGAITAIVLYGGILGMDRQLQDIQLTVAFWCALYLWCCWVPYTLLQGRSFVNHHRSATLLCSLLILPFVSIASFLAPRVFLLNNSSWSAWNLWTFFGLAMICWLADSGALLVGRRWGRRKLAPKISPSKSVEGAVGGILLTIVYVMMLVPLAAKWFVNDMTSYLLLLGAAVVLALFGIMGDLFESMLKREAGVKDSGVLLPGHGGILDRIDSLLAVIPVGFWMVVIYQKVAHVS